MKAITLKTKTRKIIVIAEDGTIALQIAEKYKSNESPFKVINLEELEPSNSLPGYSIYHGGCYKHGSIIGGLK